jgi:hypothetical protein
VKKKPKDEKEGGESSEDPIPRGCKDEITQETKEIDTH